jgi:hypothetical protein
VKIAGPDAADALAVAICHAHHVQSAGRLAGGVEGGGMIGTDFRAAGLARAGPCADRRARGGLYRHVSERTLAGLPGRSGEAVSLYTDLLVREDLLQLFGFPTMLEKEWHKLLMTVQGVGAKAAMAILGTLGAEGVGRAITLGDARACRRRRAWGRSWRSG